MVSEDEKYVSPFPQQALEIGDEVGGSQGAAGVFGGSDGGERGAVRVPLDQSGEVIDPVQHRAHDDQAVVLPGQVGAHAGPGPVFRPIHEPRPHRVQRHIAHRRY